LENWQEKKMRNKNQNVYTVGQVNSYIKNIFDQDYMLRRIYVSGEVSNCKYHPSGHIYFTLKDSASALNCIMFAGDRRGLGFRLTEGQQVIAKGSVSVFERDGRYQLYVKEVTQDGAGALYEKYEQRKRVCLLRSISIRFRSISIPLG
jgi:exodeoxyribonuclease VII large subunit